MLLCFQILALFLDSLPDLCCHSCSRRSVLHRREYLILILPFNFHLPFGYLINIQSGSFLFYILTSIDVNSNYLNLPSEFTSLEYLYDISTDPASLPPSESKGSGEDTDSKHAE